MRGEERLFKISSTHRFWLSKPRAAMFWFISSIFSSIALCRHFRPSVHQHNIKVIIHRVHPFQNSAFPVLSTFLYLAIHQFSADECTKSKVYFRALSYWPQDWIYSILDFQFIQRKQGGEARASFDAGIILLVAKHGTGFAADLSGSRISPRCSYICCRFVRCKS